MKMCEELLKETASPQKSNSFNSKTKNLQKTHRGSEGVFRLFEQNGINFNQKKE